MINSSSLLISVVLIPLLSTFPLLYPVYLLNIPQRLWFNHWIDSRTYPKLWTKYFPSFLGIYYYSIYSHYCDYYYLRRAEKGFPQVLWREEEESVSPATIIPRIERIKERIESRPKLYQRIAGMYCIVITISSFPSPILPFLLVL